ncbi:MAG: hypothetical protein U0L97_00160 [Candidatus Saccharimonadaceae bacterium]|nr:hypothetical protein [Candidatus Saccharimonadaceae bacterium]
MGKVVMFGKEIILLDAIASKIEEQRLSSAYDWAKERQRELGFVAQNLRLEFKTGDFIDDGDGFIISIFYKKSTGEALLRRDWEDKMLTQIDILSNPEEVSKVAPKSWRHMIKNGLRLKQLWETTR